MPIDLTTMTSRELEDLRIQVDTALKDAVSRERAQARQAAEKAAAEFGFSLSDVLNGLDGNRRKSDEKTVSPPKYRNPDDPTQTWTGRGRKPGWFNDALANGSAPEDLEI
ncbi:H-NS family nucleoid-associated regulatory protein [Marinibacterium sp. SX1]|uniref:H-NS histone family protein n=1 Tax=Marinibacterium sp. SX1 TaxID=3388424 RepID=UPI003D16C351